MPSAVEECHEPSGNFTLSGEWSPCNNNEITACIADLLNSSCEEVYEVAFFKVVQQQTIGEVVNLITSLWADNFCLQQ